jgi:DNA-binding NarL/FixJ family response regulator
MIRVVLADDHAFVRTGIRNILQKTPDIIVVGEASDGFQALRLVEELAPDVLVLDVEMPGLKGFEIAHQLFEGGSELPVLALSAHEDKQFILGMLSEGAHGYLTKDEVPEGIVKAVRGVARGERGWVSRRVAARIAVWLQGEDLEKIEIKSQDVEMLRMFLADRSNSQIARELLMNESQVEERLEKCVRSIRSLLKEWQT